MTDTNAANATVTVENVEKRVFPENALQDGLEYYNKVINLRDEVDIYTNFEPELFPSGFELAFVPIKQRSENPGEKNTLVSIAVVAVPTLETVLSLEDTGEKYIRTSLQSDFITKAANSVRPRSDGSIAGSMPKTVNDFITASTKGEGTKTYKELAPAFVKYLKSQGMKVITTVMLRQCLQSAAFARSTFAKIEQSTWEGILNAMVKIAEKKGLDPSILLHWLEHRDEAKEVEFEFDLSGLEEAFGESSDNSESENENDNAASTPTVTQAHPQQM